MRAPVDGMILGFSSSFLPLLISAREQVGQASAGRLQVKFSVVALGQLGNFSQHLSTGIYTDRVLRGQGRQAGLQLCGQVLMELSRSSLVF